MYRGCRFRSCTLVKIDLLPYNSKFPWRVVHAARNYQREEKIRITVEPPSNPKADWIGPPDSKSNIRPYKFHIPQNETVWQKELREQREENQQWNHQFWVEHNESFYKMKEEFMKTKTQEKLGRGESEEDSKMLTADEMSQFYKNFLDDKFKTHMQYNKDWYKKNFSLLWPAMKVSLEKMVKKVKRDS